MKRFNPLARGMVLAVAASGGIPAGGYAGSEVGAAPSRPVRKNAGTHRKDERLQKPVSLGTTKGYIRAFSIEDLLEKETGVALRLEPDLCRRRLAFRIEQRPAWEVMDALAALLGAGWEPVGEVYVLVTDPRLAPAAAVSAWDRIRDVSRKFNALLGSLTPAQQERLEQTWRLPLDESTLTPTQQELVRGMVRQIHFSTDVWQRPRNQPAGSLMLQIGTSDGRQPSGLGLYLRLPDGHLSHIVGKDLPGVSR